MRNHSRLFTTVSSSLALLLLGACSGSGDDTTIKPPTNNIQISFSASAASVASGGTVTLMWAVTGVDAATITVTADPGGALVSDGAELSGSIASQPIAATTTFKIIATAGTATKEATAQVTVDPNGLTINSFTATPNPAPTGGSVVLAWSIAGATQVRIVEGATEVLNTTTDVTTGAVSVTVDNPTHTYRLEAQNAAATAQAMVTVTTEAAPSISFFRALPPAFSGAMADASITWTASGGSISLSANGTPVATFPGTETGTITMTVTETTVFELVAAGAGTEVKMMRVVARATTEVEPNDDATTANPLTEAAVSGTLTDDTDVDYFSFTVPANGNVFLQVNDDSGDCSNDHDVVLIDTDGTTELGVTGFNGGCFNIDPVSDDFAAELPAGTYYARVESLFGGSGPYTLIALVNTAACGNGILEASVSEQCDDGNTTDGDGCSATCQVTPAGMVSGLDQDMTFSGSINPADKADYYQIVMPSDGFIFAETGVPTIGICEGDGMKDTRIYLLDSTFTELGNNDDGGPSLCSAIDPNFDDFAIVTAGTYFLRVQSFGGNSIIPSYQVQIRTAGPGCGNGVIETGEICDDSNTAANDGCSATCQLEIAGTLTQSGSVPVTLGGPMDFPRFVEVTIAQGGSSITATTTDGSGGCPFETDMGLLSPDLTTQYGGRAGNGGCSFFGPPMDTFSTDLAVGNYLVGVVAGPSATGGSVTVEVTIAPPMCGNSRVESNANEQCDDGNTVAGDGCDASCNFEGVTFESEPNDSTAMATATAASRGGAVVTFAGAINPVADHDYYSFEIPSGQTGAILATTYGALGDTMTCGFDTVVTLFDSAMTELAEDDDGGASLCSMIDATTVGASGLAAGTYYLRVQAYDDASAISSYFLDVQIVP